MVPHGSTVVSQEDVNVDIDSDDVQSVDKSVVLAGRNDENAKMK